MKVFWHSHTGLLCFGLYMSRHIEVACAGLEQEVACSLIQRMLGTTKAGMSLQFHYSMNKPFVGVPFLDLLSTSQLKHPFA